MNNWELLFKKLMALRLEVDATIVDDIKKTVDELFNEKVQNEATARTLIFQAIGEASMCWEYPENAGIFQTERAEKIGLDLMRNLQKGM